jgi:hypothetical protein
MVPLMHAWKKEGRIRYLGVTHYELPYFEALAQWGEKGNLDVVQVQYSIATSAHICEEHETTCHGDILKEHEVLHLIGHARMKDERRQEAINRECGGNHTCLVDHGGEQTGADLEFDHRPE